MREFSFLAYGNDLDPYEILTKRKGSESSGLARIGSLFYGPDFYKLPYKADSS